MNSRECRAATGCVLVLACLSAIGCGGATGPQLPDIGGSYATVINVTFVNAVDNKSQSTAGTITLGKAGAEGAFSGSYVFDGGASSGTIAGTLRSDGGVSISQFGDPNQSAAAAVQYLQNVFYWCDFNSAAGVPMSGSILGGVLTLSASITLPCRYQNTATGVITAYSTTIGESVRGNRG